MNTIQSKLQIALTSGTFWSVVALVVYNAINANVALLPAGWTDVVNVVLLGLSAYLHSTHVQSAAQLGNTRG